MPKLARRMFQRIVRDTPGPLNPRGFLGCQSLEGSFMVSATWFMLELPIRLKRPATKHFRR